MKKGSVVFLSFLLICALLCGCGHDAAHPSEPPIDAPTDTPIADHTYEGLDADKLPEALQDYYAGITDWHDLAWHPDEGSYTEILFLDIDRDGHGVCVCSEAGTGGMHKYCELICRTDDSGQTWYKAGRALVSAGIVHYAWIDGALLRFSNSYVTGVFYAETLKSADIRVTAADDDYGSAEYRRTSLSLPALFGLPDAQTDPSGEYRLSQYVLPELLYTGEDTLTLGFRYVAQGCADGAFQSVYGLDENGRYAHFAEESSNTDLPLFYIGEFNTDLQPLSVVYRDDSVIDTLAGLYGAANAEDE